MGKNNRYRPGVQEDNPIEIGREWSSSQEGVLVIASTGHCALSPAPQSVTSP